MILLPEELMMLRFWDEREGINPDAACQLADTARGTNRLDHGVQELGDRTSETQFDPA